MNKKVVKMVVLCMMSLTSFGQYLDTLNLMQYNILNYRNHYNECTDTTNNTSAKEQYLKVILAHAEADLVCFNEVSAEAEAIDSLQINVFDALTPSYAHVPFSGDGYLANAVFYNEQQLKLYEQAEIRYDLDNASIVRQIDVLTFYLNYEAELQAGDTNFLCCYVAHLKAGNTSQDIAERTKAAEAIMAYHNGNYASLNYVLLGDLNVKASSEGAYQELAYYNTSSIRFNDPINSAGAWNSNSSFAAVHTQSTRGAATNNGCFSGGGLDDRFDFILCGEELLDGSRGMTYIAGSYGAMGNDGLHFNQAITSPANSSVPAEVLDALYNTSDHLPLLASFEVNHSLSSSQSIYAGPLFLQNPVYDELRFRWNAAESIQLVILSMDGKLALTKQYGARLGVNRLDLHMLPSGLYTLILRTKEGQRVQKLLKV